MIFCLLHKDSKKFLFVNDMAVDNTFVYFYSVGQYVIGQCIMPSWKTPLPHHHWWNTLVPSHFKQGKALQSLIFYKAMSSRPYPIFKTLCQNFLVKLRVSGSKISPPPSPFRGEYYGDMRALWIPWNAPSHLNLPPLFL